MTVIPDSIEPYIGYKWLHVDDDFTLRSYGNTRWPTHTPLEARCITDWGYHWQPVQDDPVVPQKTKTCDYVGGRMRQVTRWEADGYQIQKPVKKPKILLPCGLSWSYEPKPCPHEPPDTYCSCGIYAAATTKHASDYAHDSMVLIKVALWGRVIVGDKGARGQYAYPQEVLGQPSNKTQQVGEHYGIPFPRPQTKTEHTPHPLVTKDENKQGAKKKKRSLW